MGSLLIALVLTMATRGESIQQDYADAYKRSVAEDKPLMVVVGAPWCPACNVLKDTTLEPMVESGELDAVSLVVINRDEDPELVQKLTAGERTIPQIIVYSKEQSTGRWQRRKLVGFQPRQPVRSLIRRALDRG
jgi:thioredoxin-like negative regulator of GroEL